MLGFETEWPGSDGSPASAPAPGFPKAGGANKRANKRANKYRLHGPARGGAVEQWEGATVIPARLAAPMLRRLQELREAGEIGPFAFRRFQRRVGPGAAGAAFWVGRRPKRDRASCGAKTRWGTACRARAVEGKGKCRLHGGLSTGPKTPEGIERIRESNRRRAAAILTMLTA